LGCPTVKLELLNVSAVVLAKGHNPTILHPSFLSQGIVPTEWEPVQVICTPPFSVAKYRNGITFTVDNSNLQVLEEPPPTPPSSSQVPSLAAKYIEKLPHVRYAAVGINFTAIVPCDNPEELFIQRFLKPGAWDTNPLLLKALALRFVYPLESGRLTLACEPGKLKREGREIAVIRLDANYHTDLTADKPLDQARQALSLFPQRCEHFIKTATTVFGLEG